MSCRRFPPPWSVDEYNDACFVVRDKDGQDHCTVKLLIVKLALPPLRLLSYRRLNRRSARFFAFTIIENGSMVEPASAPVEVHVPTPIHAPTPIRNNAATPAMTLILRM